MEKQEQEQIQEGKFFAAIAYLSVLCLVPLVFKRNNRFALFHGKQGLMLFIWEVGALVVGFIPFFGNLVYALTVLFCFVFSAIGIIQAALGIYWRLPGMLGVWAQQLEVPGR